MYRHNIPIHLDQQDHLLVGLTARQVLLVGCGASLSYTLFNTTASLIPSLWGLILGAALAIFILCSSLLVSFLRPKGREIEQWAIIALLYLASPKIFLWLSNHEGNEPEATESEQGQETLSKEYEEW